MFTIVEIRVLISPGRRAAEAGENENTGKGDNWETRRTQTTGDYGAWPRARQPVPSFPVRKSSHLHPVNTEAWSQGQFKAGFTGLFVANRLFLAAAFGDEMGSLILHWGFFTPSSH